MCSSEEKKLTKEYHFWLPTTDVKGDHKLVKSKCTTDVKGDQKLVKKLMYKNLMKTNTVHLNGTLRIVPIMTDGNDLRDKYAIRRFMQLTIYEWHLNQNSAVQASDVTHKPILLLRKMFNCAEPILSYLIFHSRSP